MPKERKKKQRTEYQKDRVQYRRSASRHVLVLEADLKEDERRHIFRDADLVRQCGNTLLGYMKRNYEQMTRSKRYRRLMVSYGGLCKEYSKLDRLENLSKEQKERKAEVKSLKKACEGSLTDIREQYHVTWDDCRTKMQEIEKNYDIGSIFALARAEDIWGAVEKLLFSDGRALHFKKRGDLPELRAKQINRGIILKQKESTDPSGREGLLFSYGNITFPVKIRKKDEWARSEIDAILAYLKDPEFCDACAVDSFKKGIHMDTYRPCYVSLVCKKIRGKLRVFVHITIEGPSLPKTKNGEQRHSYGKGIVGANIGTQTVAYTSDSEVGLENLAERGNTITHSERTERRLLRAMDRSRRSTNPDNYKEDGTIRKGKKTWSYSKRYRKLRERHQELCRINAENRKLACREMANHLRCLGDTFITEPKNAKKLQKRADPKEPLDKNGRYKRKKRFGRSIQNRCPGYFQSCVKQRFENTGGTYIEVPSDYRASQYDHTAKDYIKKKLSQRMFRLQDGTLVQRDWYSSFLLYCINKERDRIDDKKCQESFPDLYQKEQDLVKTIACSGKKIMNSGIRVKHANA